MTRLNLLVRSRYIGVAIAVSAMLAVLPEPSNATMMSPLGDEINDVTAHDLELLKTSARHVLEKNVPGTVSSWTNEETGHYGITALIRTFDHNGAHCGAVAHSLIAGGRARFVLPYCRLDDGAWKIMF